MDQQKIQMWLPNNKTGRIILFDHYIQLAEFIIATLKGSVERKVTLNDLIEESDEQLSTKFKYDLSWYLIQVKKDLEARKIIKIEMGRDRIQYITLIKRTRGTAYYSRRLYGLERL